MPNPYNGIRKKELAEMYGVTPGQLKHLLNKHYYTELAEVGYIKTSVTLPPRVVRKFFELHGEPFETDEE